MNGSETWSVLISNIKERFDVDFDTGVIRSKRTGIVMSGCDVNGYIQCHCGNVNGKRKILKGHQIVYLLYHEELPEETIDHHTRIRNDNSISNLKPADMQEQSRNRTFFIGKRGSKYRTRIRPVKGGKQIEKLFNTEKEAIEWRKEQEKKHWGYERFN